MKRGIPSKPCRTHHNFFLLRGTFLVIHRFRADLPLNTRALQQYGHEQDNPYVARHQTYVYDTR